MRRQPLVQLLVTLATVAIANVASELGKPVSRALSDGESDGPSAWPSRNKEEERMGAETTATWAEHLFKTLRLHKVNQLFERRRFRLWVQFMKLFHRENPERAMLLTLHSMYKDEEVATMILNAKRVSKTQSFAKKLQKEQLQLWKSKNKSPEDVFVWLQLDNKEAKDLATLVSNPEFDTWIEYLILITEQPEEVDRAILQALTTHSTDQAVAEMIIKAKQVSETEAFATKLQKEQLQLWKRQNKSPEDVFVWLQLNNKIDEDVAPLVNNPEFHAWMEYLNLITENPEKVEEIMVETLKAHYTVQELDQILDALPKKR
ncbi:hypothetical protein PsorP6_015624 [Peronosclerospora sorghi]|uniref:Uncharacterized protein n=1 Tax=Peronosclerospora sorghi TaxID=230839 RepID=A0ACC0WPY9_9STRA|nr:hypothetical protein PsorP6_015624 [Peronosclerospora sorghi]